ncbi:response regulator [Candidatus Lokiarchaeum ossiferum]|uniref:response regulator n=1 Tax=Candidatus Lokiarchaeum ossiferum TaxID=2951803 RepID=UPI00352C33D3
MMAKILIVDDAQFMRNILTKILTANGHQIVGEADNANSGIEQFKELSPDLVTMDICMPDKSGIEAIKEIINIEPNAKILVCSSLGQELMVMEAIQLGAKDFIVKPFKKEKLVEMINKIVEEK